MINDFHQKCLKSQSDISNLLSEIKSGLHHKNIERIKEKFEEKIILFIDSIQLLDNSIKDNPRLDKKNQGYWEQKLIYYKEQKEFLKREYERLLQQVNKSKSTSSMSNDYSKFDDGNVNYLSNEHDSLLNTLRFSRDIDSKQSLLLNELESQQSLLNRVKAKTMSILNLADVSNTITMWIIRRGKNDKIIFFTLVLITVLVIYISIYYLKPLIRGGTESGNV